jgi:DNA-binding NarL/FixJ family response regulator
MVTELTRIFLVDDHPLVREWLGNLLRREADLQVCGEAEDTAGALAAVAKDEPDVVIVDLSLRRSSGMDLIKALQDHYPAVKIIVLSMHEEALYAERALRAGALGYVTKRESTSRIVEAIRTVREGRVYANPELLARFAERVIGRVTHSTDNFADVLSDRELDVFRRLGQGHETRRISTDLALSMKTVQAYCARIKDKLGLRNAAELVREAVRWVEKERDS